MRKGKTDRQEDLSIKERKECGNTGIDGDRAGECPEDSHRPGQTCPDLYSNSAPYTRQTAGPDAGLCHGLPGTAGLISLTAAFWDLTGSKILITDPVRLTRTE